MEAEAEEGMQGRQRQRKHTSKQEAEGSTQEHKARHTHTIDESTAE